LLAAIGLLLAIAPCNAKDNEPTDCSDQTGHVHGAQEPLPDLKGGWQLSDGGDVDFDVLSATKPTVSGQTVMAYFANEGRSGSCPFGAVLNPEHRWANQFAGIEGYTSTCPGS
jgi:hypothetical protein